MFGRLTHFQRLRRLVEDVLVGAGFYEAYTYSLQPSDPNPKAIELPVPLSSQQRFLRTNLVQGLVGAARHNVDMGNTGRPAVRGRARLPARRARPQQGAARALALGGIVDGPFADAKGAVEGIFAALKIEPRFERAQVLAAVAGRRDGAERLGRAACGRNHRRRRGARSSSTWRSSSSRFPSGSCTAT